MKQAFTALAAGLMLAGAAVAQKAPQPPSAVTEAIEAEGKEQAWYFGTVTGGALGWENSSVVRDEQAGTVEAVRFAFFNKERPGSKPYSWLFQNIKIDCAASTLEIKEEQLIDRQRNIVAVLVPTGKAVAIAAPADKLMQEVLCEKKRVRNALLSESLERMMIAIQANADMPQPEPQPAATPDAAPETSDGE